jgi:8-oxo-dGTP diphosphatase
LSPSGIPIGIAIVEREGRFLVGTRGTAAALAGMAEFPGGKCLADESPRDCAVRECHEECGLRVEAIELLLRRTFDYAHGRVDLHFWLCCLLDDAEGPAIGGFRWVTAHELTSLNFPAANDAVLRVLAERFIDRCDVFGSPPSEGGVRGGHRVGLRRPNPALPKRPPVSPPS